MNNCILTCNSLTKSFGKKIALNNISLSLARGKITGLLGPNGSGKTTLIKLANGLLTPTSGTIMVYGKAPGCDTKRIVSYLPDKNHFNSQMTVRELILFFDDFYNDFDAQKAYDMVQNLNINPNEHFRTLSKGNKEKVQIILVMSRDAELYLLDEPIGGVDPATREYILNSIITNYSPNSAILLSTHLISDVEQILDDVIFIQNGNIILNESVDSLREREDKSVDAVFREVFGCL